MTVRQLPQPGDVVTRRAQDQDNAALHGAVLVARRDEPRQSEATDLSNVIPFVRRRRAGSAAAFPLPSIAADERPAPRIAKIAIGASVAFFAASLALHSVMLAMFWHQPKPIASVGVEAITVQIVPGGTAPAGLASSPGEQEAQAGVPSEQTAQDEPVTEQRSRVATVMPQEVPVAAQETAPEVKPQEQQPEVTTVEAPAPTQPTERTEQPQVQTVQQAPERKRIAAPTEKKAAQKKQVSAATATNAASGVGIGRSVDDDNYRGIAAAHLMRHKQYPPGARGAGVAAVWFSIDGKGRVTSARLERASGNTAFDQEVVAMARRASPFPRPKDGKGRNFAVSVRFEPR